LNIAILILVECCHFGRRHASNRVDRVLLPCQLQWTVSGQILGIRRDVVHASMACPRRRCFWSREAGTMSRVRAS